MLIFFRVIYDLLIIICIHKTQMDRLPLGSQDRNDKGLDMSHVSIQRPLWPVCSCLRSGLYWVYLHHYNITMKPSTPLKSSWLENIWCFHVWGSRRAWADLWVHTCTCQLRPSLPFSLLIFWIEYICRRELSPTCRCTQAGLDPWLNFDFASSSKANSPDNQQIPR